ncbi:hypothetical protein EVAR_101070_1 [Eumeta japonica]|uniref:Uncharacterized protein n=1 Tax=Eumeta variegata TaxID=151549 RepID=A0A4C1SIH4_EUMVA|nr:hypothetical protein EVAR_101070_1 [Eumeta japonica]
MIGINARSFTSTRMELQAKGKRACDPLEIRWSPPPMDTRNPGGVTNALSAYWKDEKFVLSSPDLEGKLEHPPRAAVSEGAQIIISLKNLLHKAPSI